MKSSNFTYNLKPLEKPVLPWALQFQFKCGTYPIIQLSSLKLPMNSQCIQATGSKSIYGPNAKRDFPIYTTRQSTTLTKMSKWCFVAMWIWISSLTYWNLNSSSKILVLQKYLFYNDCLDLCWSIVVKKWNDITSQIGLSNYYS